ncbi:MAG: hypothetical protein RI897_3734 [Verrucomicrobiota bacterium]
MHNLLTVCLWILTIAGIIALLWRTLSRSDEPGTIAIKWLVTLAIASAVSFLARKWLGGSAGSSGLVAAFGSTLIFVGLLATAGIIVGIIWGRHFGDWISKPLAGLFDGSGEESKPVPLYSIAIARRKKGQPEAAIQAIDEQLHKFPQDFTGSLLKAEIEAVDLQDVTSATRTLYPWLYGSTLNPGDCAIAHTKLADWHLRLNHDQESARQHLQAILQEQPDSPAAQLAEQRLAHLDYENQPHTNVIRVTAGSGSPVETGRPPSFTPKDASAEIPAILQHLTAHPHDTAAREKLIDIYAWEQNQAQPARDQIELILQSRRLTPRELARYLNLLADIEIKVAGNETAAKSALQRIIDTAPDSAPAHQAANRIRFIPREMARHHHTRTVHSPPP